MARTAIHPGQHLRDELDELGMSASALAKTLPKLPRRKGAATDSP